MTEKLGSYVALEASAPARNISLLQSTAATVSYLAPLALQLRGHDVAQLCLVTGLGTGRV